jgi:hypothetical protein
VPSVSDSPEVNPNRPWAAPSVRTDPVYHPNEIELWRMLVHVVRPMSQAPAVTIEIDRDPQANTRHVLPRRVHPCALRIWLGGQPNHRRRGKAQDMCVVVGWEWLEIGGPFKDAGRTGLAW